MPRRRFADAAGYTRHCWECRHARGWGKEETIDGPCGTCELTGRPVFKYTSPNNPCSHVGNECRYETGEMLRDE